jgi:hypothetical protein
MNNPYDWIISDPHWSHWVNDHKINIDYEDKTTWNYATWGEWRIGDDGPPVQLPSGARFWYIDRRKIAEFMLDKPGRSAKLVKEGKRYILRSDYRDIWSSEYEDVAKAALAALNGGDIARLLALEPDYVATVDGS